MITKFAGVVLLAFVALVGVKAQNAQAQVGQTVPSTLLSGIQSSVNQVIGAQDKTVEVSVVSSVLVVLRVNSNLGASSHEGRNNEATSIAGVASKALASDATSAGVHTIRVQYLTREGATAVEKVIDTIEFRKNAKGEFEIHVT